MDIVEYWELVKTTQEANKSWRLPQTAFNVLARVRPDLSEQIRATDADPFYAESLWDDRSVKFCNFIMNNW